MSIFSDIETWVEGLIKKVQNSDVTTTIEQDAKDLLSTGVSYIETNGLQDLYQIALTLVAAATPGSSWTAVIASIEAQAVADGKALLKGAGSIVAAQAQADLIAAGKLLPPVAAAS